MGFFNKLKNAVVEKAKEEMLEQLGMGGGDDGQMTTEQYERSKPDELRKDIRMISGCQDKQTSADVSNVASFQLPDPAGASRFVSASDACVDLADRCCFFYATPVRRPRRRGLHLDAAPDPLRRRARPGGGLEVSLAARLHSTFHSLPEPSRARRLRSSLRNYHRSPPAQLHRSAREDEGAPRRGGVHADPPAQLHEPDRRERQVRPGPGHRHGHPEGGDDRDQLRR